MPAVEIIVQNQSSTIASKHIGPIEAAVSPNKPVEPVKPVLQSKSENFSPESVALTEQQIRSYYEYGYIIIKGLFNELEIAKIKACFQQCFEESQTLAADFIANGGLGARCDYPGPEGPKSASILFSPGVTLNGLPVIKLISWVGGVKPELVALGRQPMITVPVAQLLDTDRADHLINQVHLKMPGDSVTFPWHQDIQNRRSFDKQWTDVNGKGSFVQVITAVDASLPDNGSLEIIEGSHRNDLHLDQLSADQKALIVEDILKLEKPVPLLMQPGDTVFMHPLLLHGSGPNVSAEKLSRFMFINGFSSPGANKMPYPGAGSAQEIELLP